MRQSAPCEGRNLHGGPRGIVPPAASRAGSSRATNATNQNAGVTSTFLPGAATKSSPWAHTASLSRSLNCTLSFGGDDQRHVWNPRIPAEYRDPGRVLRPDRARKIVAETDIDLGFDGDRRSGGNNGRLGQERVQI